jgi:hypothetical protein
MPTAPASAPPRRRRRFLVVLAVVAVIVVACASVYLLTRLPPIVLTISDGSTSQVVKATFADFNSGCPVYRHYSATTFANETGGATSALVLRLFLGAFVDGDIVRLDLFPVVSGSFAANLHPTDVTVTLNETGSRTTTAFGRAYTTAFNNTFPAAPVAFPSPANVSVSNLALPEVVGNGSTSMGTALLNTSTSESRYAFLFPAWITLADPLGDNAFFGVRATVTGPFTPLVSVGIAVHLVNVPVPSSSFEVSLSRPGDASRWVLSVVAPGGTYANSSVDVRVVTLAGVTVVPPTALGGVYRSPYNETIAYVPAGSTGVVSFQDVITVSAAVYGPGNLLQIFLPQTSGDVLLYSVTLG